MPASITIALVAFNPKVTGNSRLIPASGPTPGRTPTRVPTRQPTNAYSSTSGVNALATPVERFCRISNNLKPERTLRQRHAQQRVEEIVSGESESAGENNARDPSLLLDAAYQRKARHHDGETGACG